MPVNAIVIATGLRNDDGSSRSRLIRRHCRIGIHVVLRRVPMDPLALSSVAVYLRVRRFFGLLGPKYQQIGFLDKSTAQAIDSRLGTGDELEASVTAVHAPAEKDNPRVSLAIE
ncbi:MAG: hypothetical protein ABIV63_02570 [Caldimonas sp.]